MNVTLSPVAPRYAVSDADDPFKKYWWAILLLIVFTALWLLTPMLGEKSIGSTSIDTAKPKTDNVEQAVAVGDETGDGGYLSMEGTGHKRKEDSVLGSSLYQAPPDDPATAAATAGSAAAGGAGLGSASASSLASELKKVGESTGWGEKAQKGFNLPKLAGGSLSGMGAASGGSAGSSGGSSAFGSRNANIGFGSTKGLSGGDAPEADENAKSKGLHALSAAAQQAQLAATNSSNDAARSSLSAAFDGAKTGNKIGGNVGGGAGTYAALDTAPVNLKLADPKLNEKKMEPPPGADVGQTSMDDSQLGKQIAMQVASGVLGAAIGGPVGGIVTSAIMQAIQRQMDQQEKVRQMEEQNQLNRSRRRLGLSSSTPS